eukprot:CAMPEP_0180642810 /NCGR_PEP_ID=MMETSP1037_2-20121125/47424_1 /TAXON_ID=632150 /ORGANISM="Azadinium spinosum, Strain 3D9" /LENGTH=49 /DNA_ID=CAMNT_0022666165 /DNA_START=341 /DNA_END=490 /DNA_ORIENTATION=-
MTSKTKKVLSLEEGSELFSLTLSSMSVVIALLMMAIIMTMLKNMDSTNM